MNNMIPMDQDLQEFIKTILDKNTEMEHALKDIFKAEIRSSFLLAIRREVVIQIGPFLHQLYDNDITFGKIISGNTNTIDYEICRAIIGAHHANSIFLTPEEYSAKQRELQYKKQVAGQAYYMIGLRPYAAQFFRRRPINKGERYLYYPVPYLLFVLCLQIDEIQCKHGINSHLDYLSRLIMNKSVAALTLLEDQFLDSAYMPCRTVIELFVKLLLFRKHPQLVLESEKYQNFDIDKTCRSQKYSEEFNSAFNARKVHSGSRIDFIHFGFVDSIDGYHEIVKGIPPYSIKAILRYLCKDADQGTQPMIQQINRLYTVCHGYAHGNVTTTNYPILHYFDISLILGEIIPRVYALLCKDYNLSLSIGEFPILDYFNNEFSLLKKQVARLDANPELLDLERKKYRITKKEVF